MRETYNITIFLRSLCVGRSMLSRPVDKTDVIADVVDFSKSTSYSLSSHVCGKVISQLIPPLIRNSCFIVSFLTFVFY